MNARIWVVVTIGISTTGLAGTQKSEDAKNIQGTWKVVSFEGGGKSRDDKLNAKLKFTGDKLTFITDDREETPVTFTLDPSKSPKLLDLIALTSQKPAKKDGVPGEGDVRKEVKVPAIYELKGDRLKICFRPVVSRFSKGGEKSDPLPVPRPTEFKGDDVTLLIVLERER